MFPTAVDSERPSAIIFLSLPTRYLEEPSFQNATHSNSSSEVEGVTGISYEREILYNFKLKKASSFLLCVLRLFCKPFELNSFMALQKRDLHTEELLTAMGPPKDVYRDEQNRRFC